MREEKWTILKIVLTALAVGLGVLPLTKSKRVCGEGSSYQGFSALTSR